MTSLLVRRSNLLVPVADSTLVGTAWQHGADAITLDLRDRSGISFEADLYKSLPSAIHGAKEGGAEIFVCPDRCSLRADLEASVWPGLDGIMLSHVESAADVLQIEDILKTLESARQIEVESLSLIIMLGSPRGVWDVRSILASSPRITQIGLDEAQLACACSIMPSPGLDPFVFARSRVVFEAIAAGVNPIGATYPLSVEPRILAPSEIHRMATDARNSGMKGVLCLHPTWVAPVNSAFTPTAESVAYHKRVREAFAAGVAAGTAAVPLEGRMIDVPVDEWAKVVISTFDACAARDAEKRRAKRF